MPDRPDARTVRPRWPWLLLAGLLLIAIGGVYLAQPKALREVGRLHMLGSEVTPCRDGFFILDAARRCSLRDWRTGAVRWAVTLPEGMLQGRQARAVSRGGRVCAALTLRQAPAAQQYDLTLRVYRDGQPAGSVPVGRVGERRLYGSGPAWVRVLDDGRVCLGRQVQETVLRLTLFDGAREVAQGEVPTPQGASTITPDGVALLTNQGSRFRYAALTVRNGKITLGHTYRATSPPPWYIPRLPQFFADGVVVTGDGAIYGPQGPLRMANHWSPAQNSPGGRCTVESAGPPAAVRVLHPASGQVWPVKLPRGPASVVAVDADGRLLLCVHQRWVIPWVKTVTQGLPVLRRLGEQHARLCVFDRHGRLRAYAPEGVAPTILTGELNYRLYLSPDGHTVLVTREYEGGSAVTLYRW